MARHCGLRVNRSSERNIISSACYERTIVNDVTIHRALPSHLTTLVMGFGGWVNAGQGAIGTLNHLIRQLAPTHLATIDPQEFFVFTQERPVARVLSGGHRVVKWPESEFYAWQPSDRQPGLLLFSGKEPNQKWRAYSRALLDIADRCGVKRIVSIGAYLADVPHTRPLRVTGYSTDPDWQTRLDTCGIDRQPSYEGPTGIATAVLDAATRRGMTYLTLRGQAPYYLQHLENPALIETLITHLNLFMELKLDVAPFDEAVTTFTAQCDEAVARDPSIASRVRQLEQDYDAAARHAPTRQPANDLNPDQLMQDVTDFLRQARGDDLSS